MKSKQHLALIAGLGYLLIFISGIYANFMVLEPLKMAISQSDFQSLLPEQIAQLRVATVSFILMVLADLLLTWALYFLTKSLHTEKALLSAWFRLANVVVFAVALKDLMLLINHSDASQTELLQYMNSFDSTWLIGLLFFGLHLLFLGQLWRLEGGKLMRVIAWLLMIAGIGYLVDTMAHVLLSNYADYANLFATLVILPGVAGELSLTICLLYRGLKKQTINTYEYENHD